MSLQIHIINITMDRLISAPSAFLDDGEWPSVSILSQHTHTQNSIVPFNDVNYE